MEVSLTRQAEVTELLRWQRTNFRAFQRLVKCIKVDAIVEKWQFDDKLQNLQSRWAVIDNLHLQIDNYLEGSDRAYSEEFNGYEDLYEEIKGRLHTRLGSVVHKQQATPQLEIPVFAGRYTQWPTFYDLFREAVHENRSIQKGQKMQHLKGKLRGEAERLIQHLHISSENYDIAWELLTRRYNNPQMLFSKQMEILVNQPTIHKQCSDDLKRLHDTSRECISAVHNLGVDTSTWGPFLVHLLSKKLDQETCSDFKESRKAPRELPTLEEFMGFLEMKFTALEPVVQRRDREAIVSATPRRATNFQGSVSYRPKYQGNTPLRFHQAAPVMAYRCLLCNYEHELFKCRKFVALTPENKLKFVVQNKVCRTCLYTHYGAQCGSNKRCRECGEEHNTLLHSACSRPSWPLAHTSHAGTAGSSRPVSRPHNVSHVASDNEEVLLTTVSLKVQAESGEFIVLRALLDQGSQVSLMSENAAQLLGLRRHSYHASIAGIGNGANQSRGMVMLTCQSIHDDYQFATNALVIARVINNLPNVSFNRQTMPNITNINLADPEYNVSRPVDLLLDASVYSGIIMNGLIRNPEQNVIAQQTRLGWILSGNVRTFNCHVILNNLADISKYWELEDITTASDTMSPQEQYCEDFYQRTTSRLENGAYVVGIPMKPGFEQKLGASKLKALAQFKQVENKLERKQQLGEQYKQFIKEYQDLGHMRRAELAVGPSCFLPHHCVLKSDSTTTKLRVVFNASAATSTGHSLNDLMECGQNLQQDLQTLILNWRQFKYVITADIEKMFRTIFVRESDQQLQKVIWRDSVQEPLQEYCLTTITYGTKSAPFLAMRTLRQLAVDDAHLYPLAAAALQASFYMDDLLAGGNSIQEAKELQQQLMKMLKGAGMNLRKWASNDPQLISDLSQDQVDTALDFRCSESRKTLGLQWSAATDCFTFRSKLEVQSSKCHTKRQLLSDISKIFDPLGWLAPLTVKAKLLFQRAWAAGMSWDDKLSEVVQSDWNKLRDDMRHIDSFSINRHLGNMENVLYLHGFCDASEKAYAAAVYIITKDKDGVGTSRLIMAKTKLAPLNKATSLPRLELCGAGLLAQLIKKVTESISCLSRQNVKICAWTDSMVVLGWLKGDISRWKQFVANRVQQVTSVIEPASWYHVRSEDNAADCATRGLTSAQLVEQKIWWEGPEWLLQFKHDDIGPTCYEVPQLEVRKLNVHAAVFQDDNFITNLLNRHESITRVVRTLAWISRFITQARSKQCVKHSNYLTSAELNSAYTAVSKLIQGNYFNEEIASIQNKGYVRSSSKITGLNPFLDNEGLLRVGGRLANASISEAAKHAIILPSHGRFTQLIIEQGHKATLHGGARLTLSYVRNKYWIMGGMCSVKRVLRKCVRCRRFEANT